MMKCPNCSAECSDQAVKCDFCGLAFVEVDAQASERTLSVEPPLPPAPPVYVAPTEAPMPPPANPYESSTQATRPG